MINIVNPNIILVTNQTNHNEWMAFACWYSVHRNLPESKIAVIFPRANKRHHFIWLNKCHVPYLTYSCASTEQQSIQTLLLNETVEEPILILKDHMMVVREEDFSNLKGIVYAEESPFYTTADTEDAKAIVNFKNCGKFNLDEWVKKEQKHPFYRTSTLIAHNRTVNELRVLQLWRQMGETFDFINRP